MYIWTWLPRSKDLGRFFQWGGPRRAPPKLPEKLGHVTQPQGQINFFKKLRFRHFEKQNFWPWGRVTCPNFSGNFGGPLGHVTHEKMRPKSFDLRSRVHMYIWTGLPRSKDLGRFFQWGGPPRDLPKLPEKMGHVTLPQGQIFFLKKLRFRHF